MSAGGQWRRTVDEDSGPVLAVLSTEHVDTIAGGIGHVQEIIIAFQRPF